VCTTPFLGHVGGAPENGWLNGSSVGEGLDKLQCDFEPFLGYGTSVRVSFKLVEEIHA
jgi:hypothetical protein